MCEKSVEDILMAYSQDDLVSWRLADNNVTWDVPAWYEVKVIAAYSTFQQSLGYSRQDFYCELLLGPVGEAEFEAQQPFKFEIRPGPYSWGLDHALIYKHNNIDKWLLFFEDLPFQISDRDYNDYVIEATKIPEATTIILLGAGFLLLSLKRQ